MTGLTGFWFLHDLKQLKKLLKLHKKLRRWGDSANARLLLDRKSTTDTFMLWIKWAASNKQSQSERRYAQLQDLLAQWQGVNPIDNEHFKEYTSAMATSKKTQQKQARRHSNRNWQKAVRRNTKQRHGYHRW